MQPSMFIPKSPEDFIGPAARLAQMLAKKAKASTGQPIKLLLHGPPGTGKTALANMLAGLLATHKTQVESVNGRNVDIGRVRAWSDSLPYRSLYQGYRVLIVNEADTIPQCAQDAMLTLLDDLPQFWAVVLTCNSDVSLLTPRLHTRFQQFAVMLPSAGEIEELIKRFGLNGHAARIAAACNGNVRAELLDAQSVLDCQ